MSKKTEKKAERALTDADKFPIESCREKIARRFGIDAVALSGPCEGEALTECICDQLSKRWTNIKDRFAGDESKVVKLALKLGESWSKDEDDTAACVADLKTIGFESEAASGIAQYLKSAHIDKAAMDEMDSMMDEVDEEEDEDKELDSLSLDEGDDEGGDDDFSDDEGGDDEGEGEDFFDSHEGGDEDELGETQPGELESEGGGMVELKIPVNVAEELLHSLEGYEHDIVNTDDDPEMEVVELGEDIVPGEPKDMANEMNGMGDQFVESVGEEFAGGGGCPACGEQESAMGMPAGGGGAAPAPAPAAGGMQTANPGREIASPGRVEGPALVGGDAAPPGGAGAPQLATPGREQAFFASKEEQMTKEAAMQLKAGKLRRIGQNILRIGPEMSINNTDQQAGGHNLGDAKDKNVEDPKALEDGNVHNEAYTANDNNFSDGKTMGHEPKFDPHEVTEDEVSGGQGSLMGKDESYPEGGPDVPAGSSPIGGEIWDGGDVSTKGTVIATLTPQGVKLEREGQKTVLAKVAIDFVSEDMIKAVAALKFEGDIKKFAQDAIRAVKKAKTDWKDGIPHTDTSKLEGDKFTNDSDKKPEEGGAHVYYQKGGSDNSDSDHPTTNTSELEGSKFTNDAEKKPYSDEEANKMSRSALLERLTRQARYLNTVECTPEKMATFLGNLKLAQSFGPVAPTDVAPAQPGAAPGEVTEEVSGSDLRTELSTLLMKAQSPQEQDAINTALDMLAEGSPMDPGEAGRAIGEWSQEGAPGAGPGIGWTGASGKKETKTAADSHVDPEKERVVNHHSGDKKVEDPKALDQSNIKPEAYMANGTQVSAGDGSTQGHEKKFDAHEVTNDEVSGGKSSLMGQDESLPTEGAEVPAGGGAIQNEEWDGGNVSTKGTVIAENEDQLQKSDVQDLKNEYKVKEARMEAASVLAADMLQNGEISKDEYKETFERLRNLPVPAIQTLAMSLRKQREKAEKKASRLVEAQRTPVLSRPIVYESNKEEPSLVQRLSELWSSNDLFNPDNYDERGRKKF